MALVLDDDRFHLRQFPDLMTQRSAVATRQRPPATPTGSRHPGLDANTLLDGNQGPLAPGMPRLPAAFPLRCRLRGRRPGMRMPRAGWQRTVVWSHLQSLQLGVQLGQLRQQQPDDGLRLRRLSRHHFFRDEFQRHPTPVAEINGLDQINSTTRQYPRPVNDYMRAERDVVRGV